MSKTFSLAMDRLGSRDANGRHLMGNTEICKSFQCLLSIITFTATRQIVGGDILIKSSATFATKQSAPSNNMFLRLVAHCLYSSCMSIKITPPQ